MWIMFKPVKTKKVYEEIVEQIKQLIIEGKLQPGDKLLSERELSDKLNVSRASIREAFSALEMMGIIKIKPGEGSFVNQVSYQGMLEPLTFIMQVEPNDILQLLEARKILESEAAALAAERATNEDIAAIYDAMKIMQKEVSDGGLGDIGDIKFHYAIARAAHNTVLNQLMKTIADLMTDTFKATRQKLLIMPGIVDTIADEHVEIYNSIINRNPQVARQKMFQHLAMIEENTQKIQQGAIQFHLTSENNSDA